VVQQFFNNFYLVQQFFIEQFVVVQQFFIEFVGAAVFSKICVEVLFNNLSSNSFLYF
jgi:hypothetical protein